MSNLSVMQQTLLAVEKELLETRSILEQQASKVEFYDKLIACPNSLDMGDAAKFLKIDAVGRNTLLYILRSMKILNRKNRAYQRWIDLKYFEVTQTFYGNHKNSCYSTQVTQKGLEFLYKKVNEFLDKNSTRTSTNRLRFKRKLKQVKV